MVVHHMSDGTVRYSIDGYVIPKTFENVYKLAKKKKEQIQNDNADKTGIIEQKQVLD